MQARIQKLEAAMMNLEWTVQAQGQDVVGLATGFARTDARVFVQNGQTAVVHYAKANDEGHTVCGWRYIAARMRGAGMPYRFAPALIDGPGSMMCERCLLTEEAIATGCDEVEFSGDGGSVLGENKMRPDIFVLFIVFS